MGNLTSENKGMEGIEISLDEYWDSMCSLNKPAYRP